MTASYRELTDFLRGMETEKVPHTGKNYLAHVIGVYKLMEAQGCTEEVCRAGMFHSIYGTELFQQIDSRRGVYAGLEARYLDRVTLRVLRYDNRADPTQEDQASGAYAWQTRFNSAGVRVALEPGWTAIAQWLDGETTITPDGLQLDWPFRSYFGLLAKSFGRHSVSARYDWFEVNAVGDSDPYGAQSGHAWTVAYAFQADAHWRVSLEWVEVVSRSFNRADGGGVPLTTESQLQLAVRYALGSAIR